MARGCSPGRVGRVITSSGNERPLPEPSCARAPKAPASRGIRRSGSRVMVLILLKLAFRTVTLPEPRYFYPHTSAFIMANQALYVRFFYSCTALQCLVCSLFSKSRKRWSQT